MREITHTPKDEIVRLLGEGFNSPCLEMILEGKPYAVVLREKDYKDSPERMFYARSASVERSEQYPLLLPVGMIKLTDTDRMKIEEVTVAAFCSRNGMTPTYVQFRVRHNPHEMRPIKSKIDSIGRSKFGIVFPIVSDGTLAQHMIEQAKQPEAANSHLPSLLAPEELKDTIKRVAWALDILITDFGFLHGDINTGNMLGWGERLQLTDFGKMSRLANHSEQEKAQREAFGWFVRTLLVAKNIDLVLATFLKKDKRHSQVFDEGTEPMFRIRSEMLKSFCAPGTSFMDNMFPDLGTTDRAVLKQIETDLGIHEIMVLITSTWINSKNTYLSLAEQIAYLTDKLPLTR